MDSFAIFNHPFDLRGMKPGDKFRGCRVRKIQIHPDCAYPSCDGWNIYDFTQEDSDMMEFDPSYGRGHPDLEKIGYDQKAEEKE
jgi:hypothetical protein